MVRCNKECKDLVREQIMGLMFAGVLVVISLLFLGGTVMSVFQLDKLVGADAITDCPALDEVHVEASAVFLAFGNMIFGCFIFFIGMRKLMFDYWEDD